MVSNFRSLVEARGLSPAKKNGRANRVQLRRLIRGMWLSVVPNIRKAPAGAEAHSLDLALRGP